jgi:hypothetical protein
MRASSVTYNHSALLIALSVLVIAAPIRRSQPPPRIQGIKSTSSSTCTHSGNADFYGLGIRIGIYLQIFCTMLSMVNQESLDALYDAHDSNAVLLLAVFIALVKSTPKRNIELVDVIILLRMLWLIIICGFSLAHLTDEYRTAKQAKKLTSLITTPSALLFRVVVVGLVSVYNVWFWFRGVGFFQGDASCETHAFFWAKLAANGPLQGFYKFTSVILILMPPGWILAYLAFCIAVIVAVAAIAYALALVMLILTLAILYPALAVFAIWKFLGHVKESRTASESLLARERPSRRRKKIPSIRVLAYRSMVMMMFAIAQYQPDMDRLAGYWTKIRRRESTGGPGITRSGTIPINKHKQKKISNWSVHPYAR